MKKAILFISLLVIVSCDRGGGSNAPKSSPEVGNKCIETADGLGPPPLVSGGFEPTVPGVRLDVQDILINWDPPIGRVNGEALHTGEIWGYHFFIREQGASDFVIQDWKEGEVSSHSIQNLDPGCYDVSFSAVDVFGFKSDLTCYVSLCVGLK